jgi:hypothetical protein
MCVVITCSRDRRRGPGVLDSECRLVNLNIRRMDRAVFRVCVNYQYSAAKELDDYLTGRRGDPIVISSNDLMTPIFPRV